MPKPKTLIAVAVFDNSTNWGQIGRYPTERGALRSGRSFAKAHSTQTGYRGYGPVIRLCEVDAETNETIGPSWDTRAW